MKKLLFVTMVAASFTVAAADQCTTDGRLCVGDKIIAYSNMFGGKYEYHHEEILAVQRSVPYYFDTLEDMISFQIKVPNQKEKLTITTPAKDHIKLQPDGTCFKARHEEICVGDEAFVKNYSDETIKMKVLSIKRTEREGLTVTYGNNEKKAIHTGHLSGLEGRNMFVSKGQIADFPNFAYGESFENAFGSQDTILSHVMPELHNSAVKGDYIVRLGNLNKDVVMTKAQLELRVKKQTFHEMKEENRVHVDSAFLRTKKKDLQVMRKEIIEKKEKECKELYFDQGKLDLSSVKIEFSEYHKENELLSYDPRPYELPNRVDLDPMSYASANYVFTAICQDNSK